MVSPLVAKVTYVPPFGLRGNHPGGGCSGRTCAKLTHTATPLKTVLIRTNTDARTPTRTQKADFASVRVADSGTYTDANASASSDRTGENGHAEFNISILCILQEFSARRAIRISWVILHRKLRTCVSFERHRTTDRYDRRWKIRRRYV